MAGALIILRYPSRCASCDAELSKGSSAQWDRSSRTVRCVGCRAGARLAVEDDVSGSVLSDAAQVDAGTAGASARREYERRAERERHRKEAVVAEDREWRKRAKVDHPVLGRLASAITGRPVVAPESGSTRAWKTGAVGEELVGQSLDGLPTIMTLHDRRIPKSKANIDHIVVGPGGVYVIDAKRYRGRVERRDVGSFFRADERLFVDRRDCTKLVRSVGEQSALVMEVGSDAKLPFYGGLCFVGAEWSLFAKPFYLGSAWIGFPGALAKWVLRDGPLDAPSIKETARRIAEVFRPA